MIRNRIKLSISTLLACIALICIFVANSCSTSNAANQSNNSSNTNDQQSAFNIQPGPNDGRIAYMTARVLEQLHYSQQSLDTELSKRFFDEYLQALDPLRENFLQSDVDGFSHYRTNLDLFTTGGRGRADLTPAYDIFQRYLERSKEHMTYAEDLLKRDNFKFTGNEKVVNDRRKSPYPKDLNEAKELWSDDLRLQYLKLKLGMEMSITNDGSVSPLSKKSEADIKERLMRQYAWQLRMMTNLDSTDILQTYLDSLAHAYDPHSDYLNTAHAQQFSIEMSLGLFGIGAKLSENNGYCEISSLIPGGPAADSKKLKAGDQIIAVAQSNAPPVDVVDMDLNKVVQMIRGDKGTEVRLTTIRPNEDASATNVVSLIRDEIKIDDQEAKAKLIETPDGHGGTNRIGVINLPEFYFPTDLSGGKDHLTPRYASMDVAKLVLKLKQENVGGIVLDLRNNPGGSLQEALRLTGLFINSGPVVLARTLEGVSVDNDPDLRSLYNGPLIVLVNRYSASASEIVAAALQDYGRALIVGDASTHGKGTVQQPKSLQSLIWTSTNDPGNVKVTIAKFYRINGESTQLKGVVPDIILPDPNLLVYSDLVGERSLDYPLPFDTIPAADYSKLNLNYEKFNLVQPYLDALLKKSSARVATNQDFAYIADDIERIKKLQADNFTILNERDAIQERQKNWITDKSRAAERALRPPSNQTIYNLTVDNSELPGLPVPESLTQTNFDATFIATNANGSITIMTTNSEVLTGIRIADSKSVITKTKSIDPMLEETENILNDYISALSSNHPVTANP